MFLRFIAIVCTLGITSFAVAAVSDVPNVPCSPQWVTFCSNPRTNATYMACVRRIINGTLADECSIDFKPYDQEQVTQQINQIALQAACSHIYEPRTAPLPNLQGYHAEGRAVIPHPLPAGQGVMVILRCYFEEQPLHSTPSPPAA